MSRLYYDTLSDRAIMDHQNAIMREQDKHLDVIERSVGNLKDASLAINQELTTQSVLLEDLDRSLDRSNTGIRTNQTRLEWFRQRSGTCKLWLLVIALIFLLIFTLMYI